MSPELDNDDVKNVPCGNVKVEHLLQSAQRCAHILSQDYLVVFKGCFRGPVLAKRDFINKRYSKKENLNSKISEDRHKVKKSVTTEITEVTPNLQSTICLTWSNGKGFMTRIDEGKTYHNQFCTVFYSYMF